ncbi:MAG TPA: DUF92 domain-containing protein [Edaphobacter sp.]|nr:DUF92 domain-containing protein [Edaphobacter sp.]
MQKMEPQKMTSARRDEWQSAALVWTVTPLLTAGAAYAPLHAAARGSSLAPWITPLLLSAGFAALVWLLKAATRPAAAIGFLVCMILAQQPEFHALMALVALFVLTFAATRFGRSKKESQRLAEGRSGRRASQIVANLGVAALCGSLGWHVGCIAALAEAAADTVSSEMGQAVGGRVWLITTGRRVPAGTDGGISMAGTGAGIVAAALVVIAGTMRGAIWPDTLVAFAAGCAGFIFDSVLGAAIERRGWLGNDLVNFSSTLFAAAIAVAWLLFRA